MCFYLLKNNSGKLFFILLIYYINYGMVQVKMKILMRIKLIEFLYGFDLGSVTYLRRKLRTTCSRNGTHRDGIISNKSHTNIKRAH